jgi:hypothetical protein
MVYLRTLFALIACIQASLCGGNSCSCPSASTFYKLREIERIASRENCDKAKRYAFNQHLIGRISQHVAQGHSLEKSSPDYEELCNYGTITEMAA